MNHRFIRNTVRALKMSGAAVIFAGLIGSPQAEVYAAAEAAVPVAAAPAATAAVDVFGLGGGPTAIVPDNATAVSVTQTFGNVTVYSQADSAQFLALYADEIERFKEELLSYPKFGLDSSAIDLRAVDSFSIAFCDIDANGVPELIRFHGSRGIWDIGTLVDGEYIELTSYGLYRVWGSIASDGTILRRGSGGASHGSYGIERISASGRELETVELAQYDQNEEAVSGILYKVTDANGNVTSYTKEGYEQYDASKPKPVILDDLLPRIPLFPERQIPGVSGANLVKTMSPEEYRKLNEFFDNFGFIGTKYYDYIDYDTERDLIEEFFVGSYTPVSATDIEATLNRYFGITKVNHEGYGWTDYYGDGETGLGYRDGYYIDEVQASGDSHSTWLQVSMLTDNGDGTLTAVADRYVICYTKPRPDNWYAPRAEWILPSGVRNVVDGGGVMYNEIEPDDPNAYLLTTTVVTLVPYVYNGEQTWQVTAVDGRSIPKELFAE